ncbi:MAG: NAD(P)H-quinone oxidoreductase [Gemmatimonadota bacterium]
MITRPGPPEVLEVREVPQPKPVDREVLVSVRASALNRADLLQRLGRYPPPPGVSPDIPGIEFAGEVVATGSGVSKWSLGDRVFSIIGGAAHAQFLVAHEDELARVPHHLSWTEAAAVPEAFITAFDALFTQARLERGERLLVHAAASGVGLAAIQLARAHGVRVFGSVRTADKLGPARDFGLDDGIATREATDVTTAVEAWTRGQGVDVVIDLVGGPYLAVSVAVAAHRGRIMVVGTMAGAHAELDLRRVLGRRLTITGTVLRSRSHEQKVAVVEAFARHVVPLFESGQLRPVIDSTFPLAQIADAHRRLESNESFGKVVLDVDG